MSNPTYSAEDYRDYAHIGPDRLAGKFLRRFWQPIMLADDLLPGRPKRVLIMGEHVTAYRGTDGVPHVVEDRCPHRLTMLSLGWVEDSNIRCFYHGWQFDPTGQCIHQPAEPPTFKERIRIRAFPTREYLGFIFAYFGEGEAPPFPLFPEADVTADTVYYGAHPVPCNFFQRVENDLDELHLHFVHRVSTDEIGMDEIPKIHVEETDYGILRTGTRVNEGNNVTRTGYIFMPNTMMVFTPGRPSRPRWMLHLAWRVPVDDENMMSFIIAAEKGGGGGLKPRREVTPDPYDVSKDVLAGKLRVQDLDPDYPGLFNVQDNVALAGQGAIVDRSREQLGRSDEGIHFLRRLWSREMQAIAEGGTPKVWKRPAEPVIYNGSREVELATS